VLLKRQESSQRRLLQAVKELATLRKLTRPAPSPVEVASRHLAEANPVLPFARGGKRPVGVEN
jgi:hypothetical protein